MADDKLPVELRDALEVLVNHNTSFVEILHLGMERRVTIYYGDEQDARLTFFASGGQAEGSK